MGVWIMIKHVVIASIVLAALLPASRAAAQPTWVDIGKGDLPTFGTAEIYIGGLRVNGSGMVTGQLHAVLDREWEDPLQPGKFRDVYFDMMANCRTAAVAYHPTWPEGPDQSGVYESDLSRPTPASLGEKLLKASCERGR